MGWTGHYAADGSIHGRFETQFVDLIQLSGKDLKPYVTPAKTLDDPFAAILAHLDDASTHVDEVYQMDLRGVFTNKDDGRQPPSRPRLYGLDRKH
jgi:hypothetical protein